MLTSKCPPRDFRVGSGPLSAKNRLYRQSGAMREGKLAGNRPKKDGSVKRSFSFYNNDLRWLSWRDSNPETQRPPATAAPAPRPPQVREARAFVASLRISPSPPQNVDPQMPPERFSPRGAAGFLLELSLRLRTESEDAKTARTLAKNSTCARMEENRSITST